MEQFCKRRPVFIFFAMKCRHAARVKTVTMLKNFLDVSLA